MYADGRNRQLVENPLRYATDDLTVALGGIDEVESTANRLEILEGLKDSVNPDYLDGPYTSTFRAYCSALLTIDACSGA